ncbi:hypothetical protein D3C85_1533310 [compost metagenome]
MPLRPQSAEMDAAVKAITNTSKPSSMFIRKQSATTPHWKLTMGFSSSCCPIDWLMTSGSEAVGRELV